MIEADHDTKWTAAALNNEVRANFECTGDIAPGERVAFCLPNGVRWLTLFLALQKRGLAAVPLDANLPEAACQEMARALGCRALYLKDKVCLIDPTRGPQSKYCCVKLTSGTSGGAPNFVPCRAEHLVADGHNVIRTMRICPEDRNMASIPLGHSYGLGNFVLPLIMQGTPLVCASHFVPHQLVEWIRRYRVTVFPSVPALFRVLGAIPGKTKLTPLRLAISAGAPLTAEVAKQFYERYRLKIHNFYGASETGGICYDRTGNATLTGRSVGKPLIGVNVEIKHGVITVSSQAVAKGNGRWRLPDRGEFNGRGEVVLLGRRSREINIGGKKVHPSEIEQTLRAIIGVSEAVVWAESISERTLICAAVETRLSRDEIEHVLSARLPGWKLPKHYVIAPELPLNPRGKVDMTAIRMIKANG